MTDDKIQYCEDCTRHFMDNRPSFSERLYLVMFCMKDGKECASRKDRVCLNFIQEDEYDPQG